MKLCYVLPQYDEKSSENFFHISNFLEELGKEVELYVVIEHCISKPKIANIKKIYILKDGLNSISSFYRLFKLIRIYFELYNNGVKLFFARSSLTSVLPLIIANRLLNFSRSNIIFWSCGQDVVPLSLIPNSKNVKRLISKLLAWFTFKGINYLATGPEMMVEYYHVKYKIPRNKILTLYNDVSLNRFYGLSTKEKTFIKNELLNTDKKVMLFVHTFNKCRGADLLPVIAQKIKDNNLNVLIVAIGRPGDFSSELDRIIQLNCLEESIINLGKVANKDISKFYQIADLFIMPSRGEGFPRVLLESMACECPTLSFNVGGVSNILAEETLQDLLIPLNKDEQFVENSLRIINNQSLLDELAKKSYDKVFQYRTENIVQMYLDCLVRFEKV
jgi:glycosyltransferase involved in cell wall biosynthesis